VDFRLTDYDGASGWPSFGGFLADKNLAANSASGALTLCNACRCCPPLTTLRYFSRVWWSSARSASNCSKTTRSGCSTSRRHADAALSATRWYFRTWLPSSRPCFRTARSPETRIASRRETPANGGNGLFPRSIISLALCYCI